jgi:glycosyltransferase involved in cell wall biosynthesis
MKVSVIIPTYNRQELVQEAIASVMQQSYRDVEIIVIDDGSTDLTEQALKRFSADIRYVRQENRGVNAARNHAVELAAGEYIALLDSDDLWQEFKLALEVSILDAHPEIGFAFGDFFVLKPDGQLVSNGLHHWFADTPDWNSLYPTSVQWPLEGIAGIDAAVRSCVPVYLGDIYHSSLYGPRVLPSASMFRKSKAEGWLRFNEHDSQCGDWAFFAELSHRHGAAFIDLEVAFNRSHEDAVRLTRVDHRIRIDNRLDMVANVWKKDPVFYAQHRSAVDGELMRLWSLQLKQCLLAGDVAHAKRAIAELDRLPSTGLGTEAKLCRMLALVPGSSRWLSWIRTIRNSIR